jgi:tyrosine-protein phosphatase SIW14
LNRWLSVSLAFFVSAIVLGAPWLYRSYISTTYRNFRVVETGKLYRSGQMTTAGLAHTTKEYGIKTVICLRDARDDGKPAPEADEAEYCQANGIRHVVLTPAKWHDSPGKPAPVEGNLREFLKIMDDPAAHPVLIHCFAGIHRTGGYVSLYRMHYHNWSATEAIEEMKSMGTVRTKFDDEIPTYLQSYTKGKLAK